MGVHATQLKSGSKTGNGAGKPARQSKAVANILRGGVQPKLKIGAVNDPAEVEADRVADQVMRMSAPVAAAAPEAPPPNPNGPSINGGAPIVQRKCTSCDDDKVKRKAKADNGFKPPIIRRHSDGGGGGSGFTADAQTSSAINSLGSGTPLPATERAFFEPRFGRDLSSVRIHTGGTADTAASAINARAFSLGNSIAFAKGEYQPGKQSGRSLMAHEITHTLQGGGGVNRVVRRDPTFTPTDLEARPNNKDQATIYQVKSGDMLSTLAQNSSTLFGRSITLSELMAYNPAIDHNNLQIGQWISLVPQSDKYLEYMQSTWTDVFELGIVYKAEGAFLKQYPTGPILAHLQQNDKVTILRENSTWYAVQIESKGLNAIGYIARSHLWKHLPEPNVEVYKVTSGETALGIAKRKYGDQFKDWGDDNRFAVNALTYVNTNTKHNSEDSRAGIFKKQGTSAAWDKAEVTAGIYIWIPTADFLRSLRSVVLEKGGGSGSISFDLWSNTVDALYTATATFLGFQGGVLHGFFKSFYDLIADAVKGIYDLVKSIWDGTLWPKMKQLWADLKSGKLWEGLKAYVKKEFNEFYAALTGDNPWKAGHAAGYVVGYLAAEALMMFFTGGATAAAKAGLKSTAIGAKIIEKVASATKLVKTTKIGSKLADVAATGARVFKSVQKARTWVLSTLGLPARLIVEMTLEQINRLRALPDGIFKKLQKLDIRQKKEALGCNSPCRIDTTEITTYVQKNSPSSTPKKKDKVHSTYSDQNDGIKKALAKSNAQSTGFSKQGSPIFQRLNPDGSPKSEWYYIGRDGKQVRIARKDFNPPAVSASIKAPKGGWYKYLEGMIGAPPAKMKNPHCHHILFKKGLGEAQQKLVKQGQDILERHGLDPIYGKEVLTWAPNIKGQHTIGNLEPLVKELKALDKMNLGANVKRVTIIGILKRHGKKAASIGN